MDPLNVLMVGTGEYTTGFVGGGMSGSDKKVGVVALTLFDLRSRGKVGHLSMVGTNGAKFPQIRAHLEKNISDKYNGLDVSFTEYPQNGTRDAEAYKVAIDALSPGDAITIFTPDSTHFPIAMYAIQRGIHVMITKPAVKTLEHHCKLIDEGRRHNVVVYVEHHKRFDPAYADARHRAVSAQIPAGDIQSMGRQESDISYYLNSHHVDVCESMVPSYAPVRVMASASTGIATSLDCVPGTEDTITLLVDWVKRDDASRKATGIYTASWTAPEKAGVHSQQYFHYIGSKGEIRVNQAKRGYDVTQDDSGLTSYNPFYMRYAPDECGNFAGQSGYGYVSFEKFVDAVRDLKAGKVSLDHLDQRGLPTINNTVATTAILEAGRRSLDEKRAIEIVEVDSRHVLR